MGGPEINDFFGVQEARIVKFIRELSEGDPIAWGIVGLAVVVTIVSAIVKKRREGG